MEPKFDKDLEILKITLVSDELRASHFTRVGFWLSLYVTIVAGAYSLLAITDRVEVASFVFLFLMGFLYIYWQIRDSRSEYDKRLIQLNSLIKTVESQRGIGVFAELLENFRSPILESDLLRTPLKRWPTLVETVNNNLTIEEEDLKILFDKRLDAQAQVWLLPLVFLAGIISSTILTVVTLLTLTTTQPLTLPISSIVLLFLFQGAVTGLLAYFIRMNSLTQSHAARLKDYLEARKIIRDRAKLVMAPSLG